MNLKLTAMERLALQQMLPDKADVGMAIVYAGIRSKLTLSEEEKVECGWILTPTGTGTFSIECKNPDVRWEIELSEAEMGHIISLAKPYQWPTNNTTVELVGQLEDVSGRSILTG